MKLLAQLPGLSNRRKRDDFVQNFLSNIPAGSSLLDAGAGECRYKKFSAHLNYTSQDFCSYIGNDKFGSVINIIP